MQVWSDWRSYNILKTLTFTVPVKNYEQRKVWLVNKQLTSMKQNIQDAPRDSITDLKGQYNIFCTDGAIL